MSRSCVRPDEIVRSRWFNHLCPEVKKGAWTAEEDRVIMESVARYGTRWSKIVKLMPGRTDNAIKNRYNSAMRRQKRLERLKKGGEPSPPKAAGSASDPASVIATTAAAIAVALPAGTLTSSIEAVPTEVMALRCPRRRGRHPSRSSASVTRWRRR